MEELKCIPTINKDTNEFSISNYNDIKGAFEEIKEDSRFNLVIANDDDFKVIKNFRTEIRKRQEAIKDGRLQINSIYFGKFNEQATSLEKMLGAYDKELKAKVDAYNESKGVIKEKTYKFTVSTTDLKKVEKLKAFCLKNEISIKEN